MVVIPNSSSEMLVCGRKTGFTSSIEISLNLIFIVNISFFQGVYLYKKFQEGIIQEIADVLDVLVTMIGITSKAVWFVVKMEKFKKMLKTLGKLLSFEPFD
jgi:hypothetical protein